MRKGPVNIYNMCNIYVVICDTEVNQVMVATVKLSK